MANNTKTEFLKLMVSRYGRLRKLAKSQSLFEIGDGRARVYIRYSKLHPRSRTFYGLREEDLRQLDGHRSVICFLWDEQTQPLIVPYSDYEEVFRSVSPASDGQYKAMVHLPEHATELYIAQAGRFNVEACYGWTELDSLIELATDGCALEFTHSQIQTLLGAIGSAKAYDVWVPQSDRSKLDWQIAEHFDCRESLPYGYEPVQETLEQVDVIWIQRGTSHLDSLFEVEHSTPVYSGLLRFNDIHLVTPNLTPRFGVVSNDSRRSLFVRQLNRPTFQRSGLNKLCTFLEYRNVFAWFNRVTKAL